jgi:TRAP-type mannitol/chloroaromatic compound transport system substrate-binding protein
MSHITIPSSQSVEVLSKRNFEKVSWHWPSTRKNDCLLPWHWTSTSCSCCLILNSGRRSQCHTLPAKLETKFEDAVANPSRHIYQPFSANRWVLWLKLVHTSRRWHCLSPLWLAKMMQVNRDHVVMRRTASTHLTAEIQTDKSTFRSRIRIKQNLAVYQPGTKDLTTPSRYRPASGRC